MFLVLIHFHDVHPVRHSGVISCIICWVECILGNWTQWVSLFWAFSFPQSQAPSGAVWPLTSPLCGAILTVWTIHHNSSYGSSNCAEMVSLTLDLEDSGAGESCRDRPQAAYDDSCASCSAVVSARRVLCRALMACLRLCFINCIVLV